MADCGSSCAGGHSGHRFLLPEYLLHVFRRKEFRYRYGVGKHSKETAALLRVFPQSFQKLLDLRRRRLQCRQLRGQVKIWQLSLVARLLIGSQSFFERLAAAQTSVNRFRQQLSAAKRVGDTRRGAGVFLITGIPHKCPSWPIRFADVAGNSTAYIARLTL